MDTVASTRSSCSSSNATTSKVLLRFAKEDGDKSHIWQKVLVFCHC
jgi:hypothetical protein